MVPATLGWGDGVKRQGQGPWLCSTTCAREGWQDADTWMPWSVHYM